MSPIPHCLVVCIATNRYLDFVPTLRGSIRRHWTADGVGVRFLVLTNRPDALPAADDTCIRPIAHRPWPAMTLYRYHAFLEHRGMLEQARWVAYVDADMLAVGDLDDHFLCRSFATLHPGYAMAPADAPRPFERRPGSAACVNDPRALPYVYGGVQGGESGDFLAMCAALRTAIDADAGAGITACWHDESHLNRYRRDHPPERVLGPAFAYPDRPEQARQWGLSGIRPVIIALTKDHLAYRYGPIGRSVRRLRAWLGATVRHWGLHR